MFSSVAFKQIKLLLWKRFRETVKNKSNVIQIVGPPVIIFSLIHLAYATIPFLFPGAVEPILVPFVFFLFAQRTIIRITYEKANRLQEALKMMGMIESAYWISYFISEAIIVGFIMSFTSSVVSGGALFNEASFGEVLGILFVYCLSVVPFCFFLSIFFDSHQTAGQGALAVLLGCFAAYVIVFMVKLNSLPLYQSQIVVSFFPPIALQLACGSFLRSYEGPSRALICSIMFADIFIFSFLTWYLSKVWPSKYGVTKPLHFFLLPSYWKKEIRIRRHGDREVAANILDNRAVSDGSGLIEGNNYERANELALGNPTVVVNQLRKTFGRNVVVNNLSFTMYENQIFSLLGHNGAGKTTTINMLTGLYSPDVVSGHSAQHSRGTVYGHSIEKEIDKVRLSMGVCPQHDVLFDSLSVREHILFFAQLKGLSLAEAEVETNYLAGLFHLEHHLDNTSEELSGGQKRKLSVALAVCGGSKFVVLDEPTAGMDPLARRELWNLLGQLRQGRTILLTTHYMDEADTLGDRIAIMAKGQLVCCGSSQFLKLRYGSGYKLVVDYQPDSKAAQAQKLLTLIKSHVDTATISRSESADDTVVYVLPYDTTAQFAGLFQALDHDLWTLGIKTYGLSGSSLEDVFVRIGGEEQSPVGIGEDDPVYSEDGVDNCKQIDFNHGQKYNPYVLTQILGIAYRKLSQARNDFTTIPLLLLPIAASIGAAFIYTRKLISPIIFIDAVVANCVYAVGYIGVPGILAEFIVRERNDKLRNVLNVMGCDYRAYWIGTMIADYLLLLIPTVILWITWFVFDMQSYYASKNGLNFFVVMLFNAQIIAFAYFVSYLFNHPRSCITFTPTLLVGLDIAPSFVYSLFNQFLKAFNEEAGAPSQEVGSVIYWFTVVISPQGGIFACFLDIGENLTLLGVSNFPPYGASIAIMIIHTALFLGATMYIDKQSIATLTPIVSTRVVDENKLDSDVVVERHRVSDAQEFYLQQQSSLTSNTQQPVNGLLESGEKTTAAMTAQAPLRIDRLRRIYPPVKVGGESVIAVDDVSLALSEGEVFGLLGANGAGKTTLLSMLTRLTIPTSGDAYISQYSVVSNFRKVAKFLGVVTQNNALWDRLSVETHLYLFARLRGVSESMVPSMVEEVLMSLNLKPHRSKLAMQLSGGLKRKLCCAIALIGDPKVVLLDEPSAGLDPISRRQLWNVILRTMAHRSVLLTTHNMEEAEALCNRLGVMVRGQLCALGSKQHLKTKFGIGYKVTVKVNMPSIASSEAGVSPLIDAPKQSLTLATSTLNQQIHEVSMLLFSSFPSAKRIHDNGGLVTFEIPKDDLQMSRLFALLEDCKGRLGWIENYSIAQPTLEQVFIRIVNDTNATVNPEEAVRNEQNELKNEQDTINKVQVETTKKRRKGLRLTRAKCGCSDTWLRWVIIVCSALCLVLVIIGGVIGVVLKNAVGGAVSITIGIILFLIILVHVFLLCCLSCRNPVEEV